MMPTSLVVLACAAMVIRDIDRVVIFVVELQRLFQGRNENRFFFTPFFRAAMRHRGPGAITK